MSHFATKKKKQEKKSHLSPIEGKYQKNKVFLDIFFIFLLKYTSHHNTTKRTDRSQYDQFIIGLTMKFPTNTVNLKCTLWFLMISFLLITSHIVYFSWADHFLTVGTLTIAYNSTKT